MSVSITIELTKTQGLDAATVRRIEADLANNIDLTVQSYWARCQPQVTIDYIDDHAEDLAGAEAA